MIGDSEFYEDVLDNADKLELTVMALPVRPMPLAALRESLIQRLAPRLGEVCLQLSPCLGSPRSRDSVWCVKEACSPLHCLLQKGVLILDTTAI